MRARKGLALLLTTVLLVTGISCRRPPPQAGQGYESAQGYQQPDHSYLYYWMMYNVLFMHRQPTYHVYQAPRGYPPSYRPWQPAPAAYGGTRPTYQTSPSPRTTGGFSPTQTPRPSTSPRTTGGFSTPTPAPRSSSPRSSGGFSSSPSRPSSSPRSSGGFSSSRRR